MITTYTFDKKVFSFNARYKCSCGHKFTRKNTDYYTLNPFLKESIEELNKEYTEKVRNRKRNCPKCGTECKVEVTWE